MAARDTATREGDVQTADGRRLHYVERGSPSGFPIIFHHGTPGSGFERHPDPETYRNARWIAFDRAGYGGSDPKAGRAVRDAAADVGILASELGIERFGVFGVSGGGPHALACAALLPDRVTRTIAMVSAAPSDDPELDFLAGMTELNLKEFGAAMKGREALSEFLAPEVESIRRNPDEVLDALASELPEFDRKMLQRPEVRAVFREDFLGSVQQGASGWIDDDLAFVKPWGFALDQIRSEVRLWSGELDVLAPRSHQEYLARKLPNAKFELIPGAGHLLVDYWPAAVDWLVSGG